MIFALLVAGAYALATLRRYSVAQTATLTTFALFLSSGLAADSGSSAFDVHAEIRQEPWIQPCGTIVSSTPRQMPQRHNVHRTLKRIRTQLKVAQNHFRKDLKDVRAIYSNVTEQLKEQYSLPWLPTKQFEWYHKEVWCLDKPRKAEVALPKLYDTLQRYAITFHHLLLFDLESHLNTDTGERRNLIIRGMYHEILLTLCEVETAIKNLGIKMPSSHKATIVTESPNWTRKTDFTRMLVQDSGILRLYQIFLNDWMKALRNATVTGSGTCDPTKTKPLPQKPRKEGKKPKKQNEGKKKNGGKIMVGVQKEGQGKRLLGTGKRFPNGARGQGRGLRKSLRKLTGNKHKKTL